MRIILVVLLKEIIDNFRDKKTLMSSILMGALLGPLVFVVTINIGVKASVKEAHSTLELPVQNQEFAQGLISFLERQGVKIQDLENDAEGLIKDKSEDVVLVIDPEFSQRFSEGRPAKVALYYNAAAKGAVNIKIDRVRKLIHHYSQSIASARIQLRGVHPQITQVVFIEDHDISTAETRAAQFLSIMPFFLIMGVFIGGMYLAIDATAGERERGSLEPLLINPVTRPQIICGKLGATFAFSVINLCISLGGFKVAMYFLPAKELGFSINLSMQTLGSLAALLIPVCLLASAMQMIIGTFSKSFREAQTYTGMLTLLPMLPMMILIFMPLKEKLWMMMIPIFSQNLLIEKMIGEQSISMEYFLVSFLTTCVYGVILALLAIAIYRREKVLFAGS